MEKGSIILTETSPSLAFFVLGTSEGSKSAGIYLFIILRSPILKAQLYSNNIVVVRGVVAGGRGGWQISSSKSYVRPFITRRAPRPKCVLLSRVGVRKRLFFMTHGTCALARRQKRSEHSMQLSLINIIMTMQLSRDQVKNVVIRPMCEKDAPQVAEIWRRGLAQTAESHSLPLRPIMRFALEQYGENAMTPQGDVGPEGINLVDAWISKIDRTMLVASCDDDSNNNTMSIIGCIGVKVGKDMEEEEPDSTVASIWRMSVAESCRRHGVGLLLMKSAEDWARQKKCTTMMLETTNKIAARFYTKRAGYREEPFPKERSLVHHYMGIVKIYTKSLHIEER